jgi:hypothetical protein
MGAMMCASAWPRYTRLSRGRTRSWVVDTEREHSHRPVGGLVGASVALGRELKRVTVL